VVRVGLDIICVVNPQEKHIFRFWIVQSKIAC